MNLFKLTFLCLINLAEEEEAGSILNSHRLK